MANGYCVGREPVLGSSGSAGIGDDHYPRETSIYDVWNVYGAEWRDSRDS
jgi:hypothetical protein